MRPTLQNGLLLFALALVFVAAILLARHVHETASTQPSSPVTAPQESAPSGPAPTSGPSPRTSTPLQA